MTALVFTLGVGVVIYYIDKPEAAATAFGAMGVTIGGAITMMRSLIKELGQLTLLVTLSGELDAERLAEVVGALVRKL